MKYRKYFIKYIRALDRKMQAGFVEHGDRSFDRPLADLLAEIQAECVDLAGWGLVLWARCEELKKKINEEAK